MVRMTKGVHKPYQQAKTKYASISNGEEGNGGQKVWSAAYLQETLRASGSTVLHNCLNCSMAPTNTSLSMLDMSPEHRNVTGLFLSHQVLLTPHLECEHLIQTATESNLNSVRASDTSISQGWRG